MWLVAPRGGQGCISASMCTSGGWGGEGLNAGHSSQPTNPPWKSAVVIALTLVSSMPDSETHCNPLASVSPEGAAFAESPLLGLQVYKLRSHLVHKSGHRWWQR